MKAYCFLLDEETGRVQLGAGCPEEYYREIGMEERDVKQSDKDFQWYLEDKCPMKTEAEKAREEQVRISNLNMTKFDFYKKVLQPYGISYSRLQEILSASPDMTAAWDLCERVYRGDKILIGAVQKYIPALTSEELTRIFEEA